MENAQHPIIYGILMLVAGLGIPIFAALNGELGIKLQNPALAATISLTVGVIASLIFLLSFGSFQELRFASNAPVYTYFGGLFIIFYILSITWVAPRFGVGNAVAFVLLGQLLSMSIIDHYGLLGALHNEITFKRIIGLSFMAVGVFLSVRT
ncbi:MAG: DMT family transporter [Gammaproteobacteria bacterium]|nr:DMT family transporter [Gammaproteobacteria bacterium]